MLGGSNHIWGTIFEHTWIEWSRRTMRLSVGKLLEHSQSLRLKVDDQNGCNFTFWFTFIEHSIKFVIPPPSISSSLSSPCLSWYQNQNANFNKRSHGMSICWWYYACACAENASIRPVINLWISAITTMKEMLHHWKFEYWKPTPINC